MKKNIFLFILIFPVIIYSQGNLEELRKEIINIVTDKKFEIGVGIYNFANGDTLFINRDKSFTMMSVVKFPQAIVVLDHVDKGKINKESSIHFSYNDFRPNTYSPFRDKVNSVETDLSLQEALEYTITMSDNLVTDKLFKILKGPGTVENYFNEIGLEKFKVGTDYENIAINGINANRCTPSEMIEILKLFFSEKLLSQASTDLLWSIMKKTKTGTDKIKGLLPEDTIVGHKTGWSGREDGFTAATNDVGIVELPNGGKFAIAFFIGDSYEEDSTSADVMAQITKLVYDKLK